MLSVARIIILLPLMLFWKTIVFANTFIVTTNADSGPGSLREAIANAAANGTVNRDSIIFSIADNSLAGRTITLLSALPGLSSNMVLNGASQPGSPIGVSEARVMLFLPASMVNINFLEVYDCSDVGIYGMAMISTVVNLGSINGISYVRCHNLQIGRAGAGNYIFGCANGIYSNTTRWDNYTYADTSRHLTIQSNVIGLDMDGGFSNKYQSALLIPANYALFIISTADLIIGGDDPSDGNNIIFASPPSYGYSVSGVNIDIETCRDIGNGILEIKNNKFGTRKDGTMDPNSGSIPTFIVIPNNFRTDYDFKFIDNILQGQLWLTNLGTYFTIQGNTIFAPQVNTVYDAAITIFNCFGGGIIGGDLPGEANTIYNNYSDTIHYFNYYTHAGSIRMDIGSHITIKKNVMQCNSYYGSSVLNTDAGSAYNIYAYVRIDSTGMNFVKGKATPNTRIDVYLDDDCASCEGKQHLGFVMSNADSTWQYTGIFNTAVVATSTSLLNGQTSVFSEPEIVDYFVRVKQPNCGKNNGSIKGLQTIGSDNVKWHLMRQVNGVWTDSIYSTSLYLENAGPGLYIFDAWLGKNCRSFFRQYSLEDISIKLDTSLVKIQHPVCGNFNGSVTNIVVPSYQDIKITWKNESGAIVSDQADLINAGGGKYKLIILDTLTGCGDSTFLYPLINQSGPSVDINTALIKTTTCNLANGSITNIGFSNITGTPTYNWFDSLNQLISNTADLANVNAGSYRLKFKDQGGCDTITTPFISIGNTGNIELDTTAKIIVQSKCTASTGGIKNINVTNGSTYQWINIATGNIVSLNKDLVNVAPGYYKLLANSTAGCTDSTKAFYIPQAIPGIPNVNGIGGSPETCGRKNGTVFITTDGPPAAGFTFEWIDSSINQVIGTSLRVENLQAGSYSCFAIDSNGCTRLVGTSGIYNLGPKISNTAVIKPDVCMAQEGSITNITVESSVPLNYSWYNDAAQVVSTSKDLVNVGKGNYYLKVKDANNCESTSNEFIVNNTTTTPIEPIYEPLPVLKGSPANLVVKNPGTGSYELYATVSSPGPVQVNTTGNFVTGALNNDTTVYVLLRKGDCISSVTAVQIKVAETLNLNMPNAFTPNSDGHNDLFRVKYPSFIRTIQINIFNRFEQKIFESTDAAQGWDGTLKGIKQPMGNYTWTISYTDILGRSKKSSGYVLLIR